MSSHDPTNKPHRNPAPLTPAERALHDALIGHATSTVITLAEETFALAASSSSSSVGGSASSSTPGPS